MIRNGGTSSSAPLRWQLTVRRHAVINVARQMAFMFIPASLMLVRSFQVDSYGMGFGIANILHRVRSRLTPNSLSGSGSSLFGSAVWITKLKFSAAEDIYDAGRMRMHCLFFPALRPDSKTRTWSFFSRTL